MKHFVITIEDNIKSNEAADKCIESGKRFGLHIEKFNAITPKTVKQVLLDQRINSSLFDNSKFSREDNARAAFCSHFSLWKYSADTNQEVTIFEHDAIIVDPIPFLNYNGCISLGKPSYGRFRTPTTLGVNSLVSKDYFPGAHAYRVKPRASEILIDFARLQAAPTDIFLNIKSFPFLQEYYPWPVEVRETFTTIQKTEGCRAKHGYNDNYIIEEV
jgi:GR25 family glycosyltransferase involved in LPS biosynthesis